MKPSARDAPPEKMSRSYLLTVVILVAVLPLLSLALPRETARIGSDLGDRVFRWFVFWAIGVRLLLAGVRQIVQPAFTAQEIFNIEGREVWPVVRELGFANVCLGLAAVISVVVASWRAPAAFAGGLYFGLAGAMHMVKRPASPNEWIALVSDVVIFSVTLVCLAHTWG
jgi:hypothetical protein